MPPDVSDNADRQSAALPYRWRGGVLEVLLVTRRNHADEWIIPKGQLEPGHTEAESAAIEAAEEAGVTGRINPACAGTYRYGKWGRMRTVAVYDLEVQGQLPRWPEQFQRRRRWLLPAEAATAISIGELSALVRTLPDRLAAARADAR